MIFRIYERNKKISVDYKNFDFYNSNADNYLRKQTDRFYAKTI